MMDRHDVERCLRNVGIILPPYDRRANKLTKDNYFNFLNHDELFEMKFSKNVNSFQYWNDEPGKEACIVFKTDFTDVKSSRNGDKITLKFYHNEKFLSDFSFNYDKISEPISRWY